jgi:geranylgeranyl reductase family protein
VIDALVVGAGPAGSMAALRLARAGVRVCLLDRAAFPRRKLCGDTLNPGSLALLDRLGVGEAIRRDSLPTTGMIVTGPAGGSVAADYPDRLVGLAIARADLDLRLVQQALAAGARFEPGVAVREPLLSDDGRRVTGVCLTLGRHRRPLRARIVIAADGRASRLASRLGLARFASSPRRWACGAYYERVEGLTSRGEMHIRRDAYIGVAPLSGGLANVCVVTRNADGVQVSSRPGPRSFEHVISDAIAGDGLLRDRFHRARRAADVQVLGPLAVEAHAAGCPGLLLAGDAAGFVDPMTGDGMRFALRGGELAADAALRELESGTPSHATLAAARAHEFAGKWRINRVLRALVGSPRALEIAEVVARHWTSPVEYLIGVAGDVSLARTS